MAQDGADEDPESYDCASCVVAQAYDTFQQDHDNVRAWRLFQQVATRFLFDGHGVGQAFDRLTAHESPEDYRRLLARVSVLYDEWYPEQTPDGT